MQNNTTMKPLNQNKMTKTIISIVLILLAVWIILWVPSFIIYGIVGWQIGTWCNYLANKVIERYDDIY